MSSILWKRQRSEGKEYGDEAAPNVKRNLLIGSLIFALLAVIVILLTIMHSMRTSRAPPPPWLPKFLVPIWGSKRRKRSQYRPAPLSPSQMPNSLPNSNSTQINNGVNRNTSVRSIMTLPEYRPVPKDGYERTIGREGERGGMDVVVEFPETGDEEEARREEHMEALYQLRLARAAQIEALSQPRPTPSAAATARGRTTASTRTSTNAPALSSAYLETSVAAAHSSTSLSTLASILAAENDRRVSQVSYAEIGTARHDGSRVRASTDLDPLLSSAASFSGHSRNNSSQSNHIRSTSGVSLALTVDEPRRSASSNRTERRRSEDFFNAASASTSLLPSQNLPYISVSTPTPSSTTTTTRPTITTTGVQNTGMHPTRQSIDLTELSPPPDYSAGGLPDYASPLVANRPWEMPTTVSSGASVSGTQGRTQTNVTVPEVRVVASTPRSRNSIIANRAEREERDGDSWMM